MIHTSISHDTYWQIAHRYYPHLYDRQQCQLHQICRTVWVYYRTKSCDGQHPVLVPGSSRVKDALGDTIPPAPPVLRSLFNLVPADAQFPEIFLDDVFSVLSRSTWPSPATFGFPRESLSRKTMVIHSWKMSKPSQTSVSDNVFQLWKCSCLSDFLICYFVLQGNPHDTSLPSVVCCFEFFFDLCDWDWPQLCAVEQRGED